MKCWNENVKRNNRWVRFINELSRFNFEPELERQQALAQLDRLHKQREQQRREMLANDAMFNMSNSKSERERYERLSPENPILRTITVTISE
jgi:hypothetical protein